MTTRARDGDRWSSRDRPSLSMLGWALNEEDGIERYLDRAQEFLACVTDDFEVIVIDDGSTDRTWEVLQRCSPTRPWLRMVQNGRNCGSGYNAKRAISLATKDYLFWQTVDWSYDISVFAEELPELRRFDILQGVRRNALQVAQVHSTRSDNPYKGWVSYINYRLIRLLFQLPISDYQNVTLYPRALIQGVKLESESSFTNAECLLKTWWTGASFKEVPVPFIKRDLGVGKGTRPREILKAITDIVHWWLIWVVAGRRDARGRGTVVAIGEFRA